MKSGGVNAAFHTELALRPTFSPLILAEARTQVLLNVHASLGSGRSHSLARIAPAANLGPRFREDERSWGAPPPAVPALMPWRSIARAGVLLKDRRSRPLRGGPQGRP